MMPQTLQVLALAAVLWSATATIASAVWAQETRTVPVTIDGERLAPRQPITRPPITRIESPVT